MFLCVSANPAIDKRLRITKLRRGTVNRVQSVEGFAGGKAAHVAMVLRTLGAAVQWVGPAGGASGRELVAGLEALGIQVTAWASEQPTRTNLEVVEADGTVTEILEPGCAASEEEWAGFRDACVQWFEDAEEGAIAVFSGSLPAGAAANFYAQLIAAAKKRGCKTFLDASGEPLRLGLGSKPSFVKPNREEAAQLLRRPVATTEGAVEAIREVLAAGAESAAVSLGADGLFYGAEHEAAILWAPAPPLRVRSPVGSGDSAVAGFAFARAEGYSPEEAVRLAAACGAANCVADSPGAATRKDIEELRKQIQVKKLQ